MAAVQNRHHSIQSVVHFTNVATFVKSANCRYCQKCSKWHITDVTIKIEHTITECFLRGWGKTESHWHILFISSCSLNHHLYADDTQLFLSFLPTHLDSCIDHLHTALDRISSWMTVNLLTLKSSKTEFLLIGLSKQLAKINNSSLTTTHSAQNLGFISDEHLSFSDQISSVSKSCNYHIH